MTKRIAYIVVCLAAASQLALAQNIEQVNMDSGSFQVMDQGNTPLSAGAAGDGNGFVLQLGYYSGATSGSSNFTGTWTPLTGQGSGNTDIVIGSAPAETYNQTSFGDRNADTGNTAGTFSLQLFFGNPLSSANLPPTGTILSIRFYNAATLGAATFYNAVSNDSWVWQTPAAVPAQPVIVISLDQASIEWESIVKFGQAGSTAFHTTISAIPEPSTVASLLVGAGLLAGVIARRRKA